MTTPTDREVMPQLDTRKFFSDLVLSLAVRNNIPWAPTLVYQPLLRICNPENEALLDSIVVVVEAVEAITAVELPFHLEEFECILHNLAPSPDDFKSFFVSSVVRCFLSRYSSLGFLRYLSYVTSFAFFCHARGFVLAPDFAVLALVDVVRRWRIFSNLWTWVKLVDQSRRVAGPRFVHPLSVERRP